MGPMRRKFLRCLSCMCQQGCLRLTLLCCLARIALSRLHWGLLAMLVQSAQGLFPTVQQPLDQGVPFCGGVMNLFIAGHKIVHNGHSLRSARKFSAAYVVAAFALTPQGYLVHPCVFLYCVFIRSGVSRSKCNLSSHTSFVNY